jgi:tripartite-type tricarboxylate transporter receptor subunit TctC
MAVIARKLVPLAIAGTALFANSILANASSYPSHPVRIEVGYPPGGSADIVIRIVANALTKKIGQTFFVDNRPGANSNLATETVAHADPDGYTLLGDSVANAINPSLYKHLGYDELKDLQPVASIDIVPNVMDINLNVPAKTVPEFIAYAKKHPGKINMGSGGIGSSPHVTGELFQMMTGINMVHVPYPGVAPATADLFAGRIQVLFNTLPAAIGNIRAGRVRALAVTSKNRSPELPNVPAMDEFVPGYEAESFHGISAPHGTPRMIVDQLNKDINDVLNEPAVQQSLEQLGGKIFTGTPKDYQHYLQGEIARWAKVIAFSGATIN